MKGKSCIALLIVMAGILTLSACRSDKGDWAGTTAAEEQESGGLPVVSIETTEDDRYDADGDPAGTTAAEKQESGGLPVVSIETTEDDRYDADGDRLVSYSKDQVTVSGSGYEKLAEAVENWEESLFDSSSRPEEWEESLFPSADVLEEMVNQSRGGVGGWIPPYEFVLNIKTVLLTDKLLSLNGSGGEYLGGSHDMPYQIGATFDVHNGRQLSLDDLFADASEFQRFAISYVIHALEENQVLEGGLIQDYQTIIETDLFRDTRQWYLTEEGLVLYIEVYEVAPYAAGDIMVTIPYAELAPYLTDAYGLLPEENSVQR